MSLLEKRKVLIMGLPKSGTSTLATMLRMLKYQVTGPNPFIKNIEDLQRTFDRYEAFQDYPWCFEYPILLKNEEVKVIVLKREQAAWVKSFKDSYGGENKNYLSYKYMKLSKNESNSVFYAYHSNYYKEALDFIMTHKLSYLEVSLNSLNWKTLCDFLGKPIPKNIFGISSKVPKVNSKNFKKKGTSFKLKKQLKKNLHFLLGKNYFRITSFIYKNK